MGEFDIAERGSLPGAKIIRPFRSVDGRGEFVKVFQRSRVQAEELVADISEIYYSVSKHGVLRGLHFQIPPHSHAKYVWVPVGEIFDVILDLRVDSPAYGEYEAIMMTSEEPLVRYIPSGFAHGFCVTSDRALTAYLVETEYAPKHDQGVHWGSIPADWPVDNPVVSDRDDDFPPLSEFDSPF